jgi:hypothetical protein
LRPVDERSGLSLGYFQYRKATPQMRTATVAATATQISSVIPNSNGLPGVSLCGRTSVMRTNVGLAAAPCKCAGRHAASATILNLPRR